jgi:hypothetical protein
MTNQHPITPPPKLVREWLGTYFGTTIAGEVSEVELALATQAARWGADQELEACCHEVQDMYSGGSRLRAARRPKPPSEADRAIDELVGVFNREKIDETTYNIIRKQLKRLQELEALPND